MTPETAPVLAGGVYVCQTTCASQRKLNVVFLNRHVCSEKGVNFREMIDFKYIQISPTCASSRHPLLFIFTCGLWIRRIFWGGSYCRGFSAAKTGQSLCGSGPLVCEYPAFRNREINWFYSQLHPGTQLVLVTELIPYLGVWVVPVVSNDWRLETGCSVNPTH